MDLLIDFARIGLGIAGVIREFIAQELKDGTLLELLSPFQSLPGKSVLCIETDRYGQR